jgi:hypothetical protein
MNIKQRDWRTNFKAYLGRINDDTALAWENILYDDANAKTADIDRAVASLCAGWNRKLQGNCGLRDIQKKIYEQSGAGRLEYKQEAEIIKRGIQYLHDCVKGDHTAMREVICVAHDSWGLDKKIAELMWTASISHALEDYAMKRLGYDPGQVEMPDWRMRLSKIGQPADVRTVINETKRHVSADLSEQSAPEDSVPDPEEDLQEVEEGPSDDDMPF